MYSILTTPYILNVRHAMGGYTLRIGLMYRRHPNNTKFQNESNWIMLLFEIQ